MKTVTCGDPQATNMAVDVFSYAFFRHMLMKALVFLFLLIVADRGKKLYSYIKILTIHFFFAS